MPARVFCFSLVAAAFWIPTACVAVEGRSDVVHMHDFKSHFHWDFLAYCTRPVSVHLATASVGCSFNSFSVFLLGLKQQQNLMKIMFSFIHFPIWPYSPQNNEKLYFILANCMGWQVWHYLQLFQFLETLWKQSCTSQPITLVKKKLELYLALEILVWKRIN